jgi:tannase
MCWCPITNLDWANEAYEWNLGSARTDLDEFTQTLSDNMAKAYADYINSAGFVDSEGTKLTLTEYSEGIYQSGTYYDYIKSVVEESLNNFLSDNAFPYTVETKSKGFGGGRPDGNLGGPNNSAGESNTEAAATANTETDYTAIDDISRNETSAGITLSGTYETVEDYIAALNADTTWVNYNAEENTAAITSVADFVKALKAPSKDVGAFDALDASQGENTLFGYGDGNGAHFDATMAKLLKGSEYEEAYTADLAKQDFLGNLVETRINMYTPLYYLMPSYDGYKNSTVAKYWRIRTGINQGDTALNTEVNLALALDQYDDVESVDFATVWGEEHTEAERSGTSDENFIEWVNECILNE